MFTLSHRRFLKSGVALAFLFLLSMTVVHADQIVLKDGKIIEGKVLRATDTRVTTSVDTVVITFLKEDIKEIRWGDKIYEPMYEELPNEKEKSEPTNTPVPKSEPTSTPVPRVEPTPEGRVIEPAEEVVEEAETVDTVSEEPKAVKIDEDKLPKGTAYVITNAYANVRKGPSSADEKVGKLYVGEILMVDSIAGNGWLHFNAPVSGVTGWMSYTLAKECPDTPVVVTEEWVNFREGPGTTHLKLGKLVSGETGRLLEERDPWLRIRTLDNKIGWIHKEYATIVAD